MNDIATDAQIGEFLTASRQAGRRGLMQCSSGNLSWQIDDEHVLVTASRSWMSDLTAEQIVVLRLADGAVLAGPRPSVETRFHLGILRARDDCRVVLHFQSPFATTLACSRPAEVNFFVLPEVAYYIGSVAVVDYRMPGSEGLAEAVVEALAGNNLAVLDHHGLVTVGETMDEALQRAVFFELACGVIVRGGSSAEPLSDRAVGELRDAARNGGY